MKKTNWQTKKLGELCKISTGKSNANEAIKDGEYPLFDRSKTIKRSTRFLFDCEALIIPWEGAEFFPRYFSGKFDLHQRAYALFDFDTNIDIRFIEYYLILNHKYFETVAVGATVKSLRLRHFQEIQILFPPLPEQLRIVSVLDEALAKLDQTKENIEKNLQNAKEVFESYLQSIFTNPWEDWEEKTLEDVCEIQSKLIDPREPEFLDMIHVGAGNIEIKTGHLIDLKTAREENLISGKFRFDESMVLYSKIRPYLMKVVRPTFRGLCSADIYPLVPRKNFITWDYLFWLLLTPEFTDFAIKGSARAGMPKVNREHLFAFKCFLPPVSEQLSIVSQLNALSTETKRLESIYQQKLAHLDELRKSLLKKAFNGEL